MPRPIASHAYLARASARPLLAHGPRARRIVEEAREGGADGAGVMGHPESAARGLDLLATAPCG